MAVSEKYGLETLGAVIRVRRESLGMSRYTLADLAETSYPYIAQIETGYRLPNIILLSDIASALGWKLSTLVSKANL